MSYPHIISLIGYFTIPAENASTFRKNCEKMVALRDKEPGHLASAYSFDDNGGAVSREDYVSADAVIEHMRIGAHVFESTKALVEITGVEVHGPRDELEKLRGTLEPMQPRFFVTEYGFRR